MLMVNLIKFNTSQSCVVERQKVSPNPIQNTKLLSFKARPLNVLCEEYTKLSRELPPVKAFFGISEDMASMDALLTSILSDKKLGTQFLSDVVANPRQSTEIATQLSSTVGQNSKNILTFMPDSPYRKAYGEFITERFNNAPSVSELLAIRPDWKGEKLLEKHRMLYGNSEFELGELPEELGKEQVFAISDYLRGFMQGSAKHQQQIVGRNFGGTDFNFEYHTDGRTDKNVFGIILPNNKKYILKMADKDKRSLDAPFALGTLAKIDTYLTANKCRNSAPLLYYNHDRNFLIYEYIEHLAVSGNSKNLAEAKAHIPDYKALGLDFNDSVGTNNFFRLEEASNPKMKNTTGFKEGVESGEWISVDNDHVTYANRMQPQLYEYHAYLPNAMQFCV